MRCINCGKPLDDENAIFCDKCYKESISQKNGGEAQTAASSQPEKQPKKKKTAKKITRNVIIGVLVAVLALVVAGAVWLVSTLGSIQRGSLSGDLAINENYGEEGKDEEVKNIALFGLDTRQNNSTGRSDAIIVLSIDKKHNAIKMTSIARDTYIEFESGKKDKITHAWAYGKATLAVKTLNSNFDLDITDYVSVNFYQFADIIDYIGGVTIDVSEAEMRVMNKHYVPYISALGIPCKPIQSAGVQHLSGGQALAYARDRYTGSDIERGSRQREVLAAMYDQVKTLNALKFPKLIEMILSQCTTTLDSKEMLSIGTWALTSSPEIRNLGLPTKECGAKGQMINGTSYMVYDLDYASKILHDFIYEPEESLTSSTLAASE